MVDLEAFVDRGAAAAAVGEDDDDSMGCANGDDSRTAAVPDKQRRRCCEGVESGWITGKKKVLLWLKSECCRC